MNHRASFPALPATLKVWRRGACVPTAIALTPRLVHGRDFVIEGTVQFGADPRHHQHTWIEFNGLILDPTLGQFRRFPEFSTSRMRYTEINRWSVKHYDSVAALAVTLPWWRARLRSFGVRP